MFCLVSIYLVVGEALRPHMSELNGSKVRRTYSLHIFGAIGGASSEMCIS